MRIKPFKALYPKFDLISSSDSFFGLMKSEFPEYRKNGFFNQSESACLYVYQIKGKKSSRVGLVVSTDIRDVIDNKVLKHENTLAPKEQQMLHLVLQRQAMIKPVLLAHPRNKKIAQILNRVMKDEPIFYESKFDGVQENHRFWKVAQKSMIDQLVKLYKEEIPQAYIADGHHRSSTGAIIYSKQKKKNQLLSVYFPFSDLHIYDYNRVVEILQEISPSHLIASISKVCKVKILNKPRKPKQKHEMVMLFGKEIYSLKWRKSVLKKFKKEPVIFDTALLQKLVLNKIMGVKDVRNDSRVKYMEGTLGIHGIEQAVHKNPHRVGFAMYPISSKELMTIADLGKTLPPKSTWFEPRVKNGLISQLF